MNFEKLDDLLIETEEIAVNTIFRTRHVYDRTDNFTKWDDIEFCNRFRLSRQSVLLILDLIKDDVQHRTDRNNAVPPLQQLLITLRFYACSSFQIVLADFGGIHRTTAGQIVKRVTEALVKLKPQFIFMPENNEERSIIKEQFYKIFKFPRVLGAIDCTHIRIQNPGGDNAERFRNRNGYFSLNVQVVSNANHKIKNIVCRWPGSSHDSNIFRNSLLRMKFENGEMGRNVLLGDSGYPLLPYLITPLKNPVTPAEQLFNEAQIKTRNIVERTFGIWKRRFPVLSMGMRNKVETCQNIVVATAILQNIAQDQKDPLPTLYQPEESQDIINIENMNGRNSYRTPFIEYFQTLL